MPLHRRGPAASGEPPTCGCGLPDSTLSPSGGSARKPDRHFQSDLIEDAPATVCCVGAFVDVFIVEAAVALLYIALGLVGLLLALALAGASYQAVVTSAGAHRFPEPGRLVDIKGYRLKFSCTGSGSSTVIVEAGFGDVLTEWKCMQPEIAKLSSLLLRPSGLWGQ